MDYRQMRMYGDSSRPATIRDLVSVLRSMERDFVDVAAKVSDVPLARLLYQLGTDLGRWQRELHSEEYRNRFRTSSAAGPEPRYRWRESVEQGDAYRLLCDIDQAYVQLNDLYGELITSWEGTDLQPVLTVQQRELRTTRHAVQRLRDRHNPYLYTVDLRPEDFRDEAPRTTGGVTLADQVPFRRGEAN